jgi:GH35 family endo-1,4-beta-xylanase
MTNDSRLDGDCLRRIVRQDKRRWLWASGLTWCFLLAFVPVAASQTVAGSSLSYRSSGSGSGDWILSENGYVGTYISLPAQGPVTLAVSASGATNDLVAPHMNLVIADTKVGFDVAAGFANYQHTFELPAGTYFVRAEFNNDVPTANRQLTIGSLDISGATVSNTTNAATNDANALTAADTYIANFRRGPATIALSGVAPGTQVQVKMVRNAFNFGTMVQGFDPNVFLAATPPGDTTSTAYRYQNFVNSHFNILVPSNMGKWAYNEATQNIVTMGNVDTILNYAQAHKMNVRAHNLIWGTQQPSWVNTLITNAGSSNPAVSGPAKASLMTAIANRIEYYVGDGDNDTGDGDRSKRYQEIDVLNEALRYPSSPPNYWEIFGSQGVAQIYKMAQDAVTAAGANTRLYTNEYNVFQFANNPDTGASDPYANWYRRNVENLNNAGYGQVVTGIGIQSIADPRTALSSNDVHSAARINQVLQNLSVTGLPITLSEFSVPTPTGFTVTPQRSAQIYSESLRMLYGSPQATSFLIWEPWPPATTDVTTIVDSNWNLTQSGQALVNLLDSWTTPTQNLTVGADGTIDFTGYFGEYEITIAGDTFPVSLIKGTPAYSIPVAPGDYNGDGTVDAADYVLWRRTLGSISDLRADGNGNLTIDGGDYQVWQLAFGTTYSSASSALGSATAPEPATLALMVFSSVFIHALRRGKSRLS